MLNETCSFQTCIALVNVLIFSLVASLSSFIHPAFIHGALVSGSYEILLMGEAMVCSETDRFSNGDIYLAAARRLVIFGEVVVVCIVSLTCFRKSSSMKGSSGEMMSLF